MEEGIEWRRSVEEDVPRGAGSTTTNKLSHHTI